MDEPTKRRTVSLRITFGLVVGCCFGILSCLLVSAFFDRFVGERGTQLGDIELAELDDSASIEKVLRSILNGASSTLRYQDLYVHIDDIDTAKLIELIDLSSVVDRSPLITGLQGLMLGELAREDPTKALSKIWLFSPDRWTNLLVVVFAEWAQLNVQEAMQAASQLQGDQIRTAFQSIVTERDDISDFAILDIAKSLGVEVYVEDHVKRRAILRKLDQPQVAWDLAKQGSLDDLGQIALFNRIAAAWKEQDGWEVLNHLYDNVYHNNYLLFDELLNSIASDEPYSAFEFALNMPVEKQDVILPRLLRLWADAAPKDAFDATSRIVKNSIRARARNEISMVWATKDPTQFLDSVESLPRNLLRQCLSIAIRGLAQSSPNHAALRVQSIRKKLGAIPVETEFALVEEWTLVDVAAAKEWVNENAAAGSQKRSRMMQRVVSQYALIDAENALRVALAEEPHEFHDLVGLETYVIDSLVSQGKVDQAQEFLAQVRESARISSYSSVGRAFLRSDRVSALIDLASQLPEEEQSKYFYSLSYEWFQRDPNELVDSVTKISSSSVRAEVAQSLLLDQGSRFEAFTEEQIEHLQSIVNSAIVDRP